MVATSSRGERWRVAARVALGRSLGIVPLALVERARRRHLLVPLLRHRDLTGLGTLTVDGALSIRLVAVDSRLVRLLYWYGEHGYEAHEVLWWRHLCSRATSILEIGANVGYYTVQGALAAPGTPYRAVEAHPESAAVVRRNLALNAITHVEVVQAAAVACGAVSSVELALPELERYAAPTGAFVRGVTEGVEKRRPAGESLVVPAVAAATLVDGVDLVKLDIEGSEHLVLAPVVETLVAQRATIVVEVLRDTPLLRELLVGLAERDYTFWLICGPELREIGVAALRSDDLVASYGCRDLAVVPRERTDLLTRD